MKGDRPACAVGGTAAADMSRHATTLAFCVARRSTWRTTLGCRPTASCRTGDDAEMKLLVLRLGGLRSSAYGWKTAGTRYSSYAADMSSAHTRLASLGRGHPASEVRRYKTAPCREASDVWHLGGHQHTTALQFGAWFGYESQTR